MASFVASLLGLKNKPAVTVQRRKDHSKVTYEEVDSKVKFNLTLEEFTNIHEIRTKTPAYTAKANVNGIGCFLIEKYEKQIQALTNTEKSRAEKSALKKGSKRTAAESGVGVGMFEEGEEDAEDKEAPEQPEDEAKTAEPDIPAMTEKKPEVFQPKIEEKLEYGERDILQRAKVYINRDSVKNYKRFWTTWKSKFHIDRQDALSNTEEVKTRVETNPGSTRPAASGEMNYDFAPVPRKLGSLIPNCNNLYRPKDGKTTSK